MTDEQQKMLVETHTMVKLLYEDRVKYSTCERVDAVADKADHAYNKIADHIKDHRDNRTSSLALGGAYLAALPGIIHLAISAFKGGGK